MVLHVRIIMHPTMYIVQYIIKAMKLMMMKAVAAKQMGTLGVWTHTGTIASLNSRSPELFL